MPVDFTGPLSTRQSFCAGRLQPLRLASCMSDLPASPSSPQHGDAVDMQLCTGMVPESFCCTLAHPENCKQPNHAGKQFPLPGSMLLQCILTTAWSCRGHAAVHVHGA